MKKTGKVINFDDHKVYIITDDKEFVTLERNNDLPVKGHSYTGKEYIDKSIIIKNLISIIAISLISIGIIYYIFFSPRATIIVNMGDNLKIGINRNKIVDITDINGLELSEENFPSVKGSDLNEGLTLLFDYCIENEVIPACDVYTPGDLYIYITKDNSKEDLNFETLEEYTHKFNYDVIINRNDNVLN